MTIKLLPLVVMLRLSPPHGRRLLETYYFEADFGGGESNVAISLANFGFEVQFVTRLPKNDLGQACLRYLHKNGVGTDYTVIGGERIGVYFLEQGAVQRGSKVLYDRADSALAKIQPDMVDWDAVFNGANWFHFTGITPAVSEGAAASCITAVKIAREKGVTISCDLNYRNKLWKWGKTAECNDELVKNVDVLIEMKKMLRSFRYSSTETDIQLANGCNAVSFVCEKLIERSLINLLFL